MTENNDINTRYIKTVAVIQSCLNEEHINAASKTVDNFVLFINDSNRHITSPLLTQLRNLLNSKKNEITR